MTVHQVHVRKDELTNAALIETEATPLAQGAVRLKVESFSVTANNITYAVVGDGFKYWDFFPPKADNPEGLGIVPMCGGLSSCCLCVLVEGHVISVPVFVLVMEGGHCHCCFSLFLE